MADLIEDLITTIAQNVFGTLLIQHPNGKKIDLKRPWRRARLTELVADTTRGLGCEWKFDKMPLQDTSPILFETMVALGTKDWADAMEKVYEKQGLQAEFAERKRKIESDYASSAGRRAWDADRLKSLSPAEQLVEVYEKLVEPTLIDPCFVTHVPSVIIPLARENKDDPFFADVYELAINGVEISPGYSELNDPDAQAKHFAHQVGNKEEQQKVDEDFLNALKTGMPPAGGLGMGIDRLVMMLTGAESIRDVILFPLLKPQG
jgi:lysyl-tRNA synthetase, class II